jgi:c-di-GMP-related signal transduction protein
MRKQFKLPEAGHCGGAKNNVVFVALLFLHTSHVVCTIVAGIHVSSSYVISTLRLHRARFIQVMADQYVNNVRTVRYVVVGDYSLAMMYFEKNIKIF